MLKSNIFKLILANSLPPIVIILATPLLLISHKDSYGQYTLISSLAAVLAVISSGRYEQLLPLVPEKERPFFIRSALKTLCLIVVVVLLSSTLICIYTQAELYIAIALASLVLGQGVYQIVYYKFLADQNLNLLNISKMTQILIMLCGQLSFITASGLWISEAISRSVMWLFMINGSRRKIKFPQQSSDNINQYLSLDTLNQMRFSFLIGSVISAVSVQVPFFLLSAKLHEGDLALYASVDRMLHLPLLLLSTTIGQYYFSSIRNSHGFSINKKIIYMLLSIYILTLIIGIWTWEQRLMGFGLSIGWVLVMLSGFVAESGSVAVNQILSASSETKRYRVSEGMRLLLMIIFCGSSNFILGVWAVPFAYSLASLMSVAFSYRVARSSFPSGIKEIREIIAP